MKERFNGTEELTTKALKEGYGIVTKDFFKIKDGIINTSFRIIGEDDQKYVFRVYKQNNKTLEEISFELGFMDLLRKNSVPTPRIFANLKNEEINTFCDEEENEWRSMLMEFADGRHLEETDYDIIPEFAKYHAMMHKVSLEHETFKSNEESIANVLNWMNDEAEHAIPMIENDKVRKVFTQIIADINNEFNSQKDRIFALPSGHTHLDYDSNNVIVKDGHIKSIIDFDDMQIQPYALDSAYSLWWWTFNNPQDQMDNIVADYLASYNQERQLSDEELKMMQLFLRARNATLAPLLFINNADEIDENEFFKALKFDEFLRNNPLYFKRINDSLKINGIEQEKVEFFEDER